MGTRGTLMTYRPDIKVLDATLRDGGLVNNFYFSDEFVRELYQANIKAGVDYMEFGYKASKELFDVNKFGPWKFCDEEDIRRIVGNNDSDLKIAVMADVGRTEMDDIPDKSESVIDLVRVATYIHQMPAAIDMIEQLHAKGYETSVNIMLFQLQIPKILNKQLRFFVKAVLTLSTLLTATARSILNKSESSVKYILA